MNCTKGDRRSGSSRHGRITRRVATILGALSCASLAALAPSTALGQTASVSGVVYDSVSKRPLSGATVQLVERANPAKARWLTTQDNGAYRFDSVSTGTYLLGFIHQTLDSLGVMPPLRQVTIDGEAQVKAPLAVPSAASVVRLHCGTAADSGGAWIGSVRSAINGLPVRGASVKVQWNTVALLGKRIVRETPEVEAVSAESGFFVACYVPHDEILVARAVASADSSGVLSVLVPPDGLVKRDLFLAPSVFRSKRIVADSAPADSGLVVDVRSGSGVVRGRVVDQRGKPLGDARVRLGETGAETLTNQDGYYVLDSLPLGSFTFDARALGYLPAARPLDVVATGNTRADFAMQSRGSFLDTVRVVGQRLLEDRGYIEFLARQKAGFGQFFDEKEMARRDPIYLTDMLRLVPGAIALPGPFGGQVLFRSLGGSGYCEPLVILDGLRMVSAGRSILDDIAARDVRAMEVYARASNIPLQFRGSENCGVIVITTGRRQAPPLPQ